MASMARAPKFNSPRHTPPASGWKVSHRAPGEVDYGAGVKIGGFYGQLDGVCLESTTEFDAVSDAEKRAFPGDSDTGDRY